MGDFTPERLTLARRRRGLSKKDLADACKISYRSVVAYESGDTVPEATKLLRFAHVLRFRPNFFERPAIPMPTSESATFRSQRAMTASVRERALGAGALAVELEAYLAAHFHRPGLNLPNLCTETPESAAMQLRMEWGLGEQPIRNVVHLLELHGVRVYSMVDDHRTMDAFSTWVDGRPYMLLNLQRSGERRRFDAAHELGHLVMHPGSERRGRDVERDANEFAAAFLMPRGSVLSMLPRALITVEEVIRLKHAWNVAATALTWRLRDLRILSAWHYRSLLIEMSQAGYRTTEPEPSQPETSQALEKMLKGLWTRGLSPNRVARELGLFIEDFGDLTFRPTGLPAPSVVTDGEPIPALRVLS